VDKITTVAIVKLVKPEGGAKHELLFNKLASGEIFPSMIRGQFVEHHSDLSSTTK
jgi:hypothetical protein